MSGKRTLFVAALALIAMVFVSIPAQAGHYEHGRVVEYHHHPVPHYYGPRIVVTTPPVCVTPPVYVAPVQPQVIYVPVAPTITTQVPAGSTVIYGR